MWRVPVAAAVPALDRLSGWLDSAEQDRVASFKDPPDRIRYIAAHGVLRWLLGAYLGRDPRAIRFRMSRGGKPGLRGASPRSRLQFNLSHDGDLALIGLARFANIGIDVQGHTRVRIDRVAAGGAFSATELAGLAQQESGSRRDSVLQLWARKEAAVKAIGSGLALSLDQIEVAGQSPVSIVPPGRPLGMSITIQDLDVGPEYVAAIATPGWCQRIVDRVWTASC